MIGSFFQALSFLTIFPVPQGRSSPPVHMFASFPVVGAVIGACLVLINWLPLRSDISTFVTLLAWVVVTGGLHVDGFADACDGLLAVTSVQRRLEIMRDSRVGVWGASGIALLFLGKFVLISGTQPVILFFAPILARLAMVLAAWLFPLARPDGLGAGYRQGLSAAPVIAALCLALLPLAGFAWLLQVPGLLLLSISLLIVPLFGGWAARKLGGGLTGDTYGAICELTELLVLLLAPLVSV